MQADYGENELRSVLLKAKIFNKNIGSYQRFVITENFDYAVLLSNGRILIKWEDLQDDERDALTPERLKAIADRFTSSTPEAKVQPKATVTNTSSTKLEAPKKKTNALGIVLTCIGAVGAILIISLIINDHNKQGSGIVPGNTDQQTYQEKVMTVAEIERSQPTNFLSADGTYRENFWGDKLKVSCKITNKATVASYKDAIVRVTYYTKTKTVLGTKDYTVYEVFSPTSTKTVELKIDNYKDVASIGWDVIKATAY
jgi:hypothetical protein